MENVDFLSVESYLDIYDQNGVLLKIRNEEVASTLEYSSLSTFEGEKKLKLHYEKERDASFMRKCKEQYAKKDPLLACEACGFSFQKVYGDIGKNFIEGHHTKPIGELTAETQINDEDIKMVCSNCHSMIHSRYPCFTIEEIKGRLHNMEAST